MGKFRMPSAMQSVCASSTWVRERKGPSMRTRGITFPPGLTSVTSSLEANSPGCKRSRSCDNAYPGPNSFSRSSWQMCRCRAETPIGIIAFSDCVLKPLMPYISTSRSTLVTTLRTCASTCALSPTETGKMSRRCAQIPHVSQSPTRLFVVCVVRVMIAIKASLENLQVLVSFPIRDVSLQAREFAAFDGGKDLHKLISQDGPECHILFQRVQRFIQSGWQRRGIFLAFGHAPCESWLSGPAGPS